MVKMSRLQLKEEQQTGTSASSNPSRGADVSSASLNPSHGQNVSFAAQGKAADGDVCSTPLLIPIADTVKDGFENWLLTQPAAVHLKAESSALREGSAEYRAGEERKK
jgi:hypothetical protein